MKKSIVILSALLLLIGTSMTFNNNVPVEKGVDDQPDSIKLEIKLHIPKAMMLKSAIISMTPKYGEHTFKSIWCQGEHAEGNYDVINHKDGANFEYSDVIAYSSKDELGDLSVDVLVRDGNDVEEANVKLTLGEEYSHYWHKKDKKALLVFEWVKATEITNE